MQIEIGHQGQVTSRGRGTRQVECANESREPGDQGFFWAKITSPKPWVSRLGWPST
jgi:hypothetical protein